MQLDTNSLMTMLHPAATGTNENTTYKALRIDADGTAQLRRLAMRHAVVLSDSFWCRPDRELKEGDRLRGSLEFPPSEVLSWGRLPIFTVRTLRPA